MSDERQKHYLFPSTLFVSNTPHEVTTILGTCVAVCLFDSKNQVGGINHYMLPFWNGNGLPHPKYGNIAIARLYEKVLKSGAEKKNLVAKVFGGWTKLQESQYQIGERNIQMAKETLKELGIKIVSESIGGSEGRLLKFHTDTGTVFMKFSQISEPVLQDAKN
jgi:chemotaxis protein CheD